MADEDERREDEHEDEEHEDEERQEPETLDAARERIGALERELAEVRQQSIKRRDRIKTLEGELATAREGQMDEQERAVEKARREEREKLEGEHRADRVRSAVLLAAATKLRDPQDAMRYLDLEELAGHDDGELDKVAARAVDQLVETKEYLAAGKEDAPTGARAPGPRSRQPAGTREREQGVNERIRKSLR